MRRLPTVEQVRQLPTNLSTTVPPEYIDHNGHMNVRHYLDLQVAGCELRFGELDMGGDYPARSGGLLGIFTAEHHLSYYAEVHEGDTVSVHPRLVGASDKVMHIMALTVNDTTGRLAATMEVTIIHVDMTTRRPVPMPEDHLLRVKKTAEDHAQLEWPAPVCGVMGVTRRKD